jgi:hypothetical protein
MRWDMPFIIHNSSFIIAKLCRRQDLNLHILRYEILSLARLPISPLRPAFSAWPGLNITKSVQVYLRNLGLSHSLRQCEKNESTDNKEPFLQPSL